MIEEYAFLIVPAAAILAEAAWSSWVQQRETRKFDDRARATKAAIRTGAPARAKDAASPVH